MKGNKMSAILAILLMLSGTLVFIPHANAQTNAGGMEVVPKGASALPFPGRTLEHMAYGINGTSGSTFTVSVWVYNVAGLFSFGSGLYFNTTDLKVVAGSVVEGGFLSNHGANALAPSPISIVNTPSPIYGYVSCGWSLYDAALSASGSGPLFNATFQVLAGATPFTGSHAPGQGVLMGGLTLAPYDPAQTVLIYEDGYSIISPANNNIYNGTFLMSVSATPGTAVISITSPPTTPYYAPTTITLSGAGSLAGSTGVTPGDSAIDHYYFDNGSGTYVDLGLTNTYTTPFSAQGGPYTARLIVHTQNGLNSTAATLSFSVLTKPTGCNLDAFTQPWRYIDPIYIPCPNYRGKGYNQPAELFRPGDLVQIFVTTLYGGAPVQDQMVGFEVWNNSNIIATGQTVTNSTAAGEIDFRIPWPCTGAQGEFGTWKIIVTWEIGGITQNDTLSFNVNWGVWSTGFTTTDVNGNPINTFYDGSTMYVKYNIVNAYQEGVDVLNVITVYDALMVPVGFIFEWVPVPASSTVSVGPLAIALPKWAFVGTGTVTGDEMTAWPSGLGISWGPEQSALFTIKSNYPHTDP